MHLWCLRILNVLKGDNHPVRQVGVRAGPMVNAMKQLVPCPVLRIPVLWPGIQNHPQGVAVPDEDPLLVDGVLQGVLERQRKPSHCVPLCLHSHPRICPGPAIPTNPPKPFMGVPAAPNQSADNYDVDDYHLMQALFLPGIHEQLSTWIINHWRSGRSMVLVRATHRNVDPVGSWFPLSGMGHIRHYVLKVCRRRCNHGPLDDLVLSFADLVLQRQICLARFLDRSIPLQEAA